MDENRMNLRFDYDGYLEIHTDGCCFGNDNKDATRKAGIGVWFNKDHPYNFFAPVKGTATNNNAEIQAATEAIRAAAKMKYKKVNIHTDSMFVINCMKPNGGWVANWKRNNWRTSDNQPVKNRESLEELVEVLRLVDPPKWTPVSGHSKNPGNDGADALAKRGAQQYGG